MSIFGRNIIDKLKSKISSSSTPSFFRFLLPVPPYDDSRYWNKAYESLTSRDVYEWGDFTMEDIRLMKYRHVYIDGIKDLYGDSVVMSKIRMGLEEDSELEAESEKLEEIIVQKPLDEIIGVPGSSEAKMDEESEHDDEIADKKTGQQQQPQHQDQSILILGCGNSNLGEEIYHYYHHTHSSSNNVTLRSPITKIVQCDVSSNVVRTMRQRYNLVVDLDVDESIEDTPKVDVKHSNKSNGGCENDSTTAKDHKFTHFPHMSIMEADATKNLTFDNKFDAIIDKGLVDALFCSTGNSSDRNNSASADTSTGTDTEDDDAQRKTIHNINASMNTSKTPSSPATASMTPLQRIMMNVHRSLKVGAVFIFFSFSRPEYLLEDTVVHHQHRSKNKRCSNWNFADIDENADENAETVMDLWSEVNVCELESIFMYRFVKKDCSALLVSENDDSSMMPSLHGTRSIRTKSATGRKKRSR